MREFALMLIGSMTLASCNPAQELPQNRVSPAAQPARAAAGWAMTKDADIVSLIFTGAQGAPVLRIACVAGDARLVVNVPAFKAIGSEERLSLGADGESVALVADARGDKERGGVSGEGRIPDELKRLITAPLSAAYGAQTSGPHAPPPQSLAAPFLTTCSEYLTRARVGHTQPKPGTSPCQIQDGTLLRLSPMRAIGTEPFWNAKTDGRCVTYSTPEDQQGTRIWTKVETGPMGRIWVGSHQGKPFVLRLQPAVRCSDGMSDRAYDWEATLTVGGEERKGCAERI